MIKKISLIGVALSVLVGASVPGNARELLETTNFNSGISLPWNLIESDDSYANSSVEDGKYVIHMNEKGVNQWDVRISHKGFSIKEGYRYRVKFSINSTKDTKIYAKVGDRGEPYGEVWNNNWNPFTIRANQALTVEQQFTAYRTCNDAEFAFHLGGVLAGSVPLDIQLISVSLDDGTHIEPTPTLPIPTPTQPIPSPTLLPGICVATINPSFSFTNKDVLKGFRISGRDGLYNNGIDDNGVIRVPNTSNGLSRFTISKPGYLSRTVDLLIGTAQNPIDMWAGDINGDNRINMADVISMVEGFNSIKGNAEYSSICDFNQDQCINMADVMILVANFGKTVNDYPVYKAY
ncbi:MAG TPA: carbohydrate binding domain-containing protein [Pseudobacteroides sp.]|uniref:carbohydrate binding domain-containing protein n=1 Tax=Pseudobacteroides sp. TaxID=1968840 RepID=UPI002F924834